ncbi:glycosyltransferase family 2 protein [Siccirubricoccus phaeus]|uniref:glycosyltransferase family 2 protein n=1 Tax=Siccirubricoccus phaeus TaxID=2595053 RepID=UPI0011F2C077|nr:glycosyltransferase family 2 protein [Siccirubricoccus phaeus]
MPPVSVLMTSWNGAASIGASIASILGQSFSGFELVVVDDGSTDGTAEILAGIGDPRLRVLRPGWNLGIVGARNYGFAACRGEYLAVLDHDDLAHPERLAQQVAALAARPEMAFLGTGVAIEQSGRRRGTDHPPGLTPLRLRWGLLVDNPFTWSSMMFRMAALRRLPVFLRPEAEYADDFDLYHRLLAVGEPGRLEAVLTTYRWHQANTTHAAAALLTARAEAVLATAYRPFLGEGAEAAAKLAVRHLSDRQPVREAAVLPALGEVLRRLLAGFSAGLAPAERAVVAADAGRLWWRVARAAARSGQPWLLRHWRAEPGLAAGFRPGVGDVAASAAIGLLRAARRLA